MEYYEVLHDHNLEDLPPDELKDMLTQNNINFNYTTFFKKGILDETQIRRLGSVYGAAVAVITDEQCVTTETERGRGWHVPMIKKIIEAIYGYYPVYEIKDDEPPYMEEYAEPVIDDVDKELEELIDYAQEVPGQPFIIIKMWFTNENRNMMFNFPESITKGHLRMLQLYQRLYGEDIDRLFSDDENTHIHCNLFDESNLEHNKKGHTLSEIVKCAEKRVTDKEYLNLEAKRIGFSGHDMEAIIENLVDKNYTLQECDNIGIGVGGDIGDKKEEPGHI